MISSRPSSHPRLRSGARVLPALAALAVAGLLSAAAIAPSAASPYTQPQARDANDTQAIDGPSALQAMTAATREGFSSEAAPPPPVTHLAPAAGIPDPGTAKAIGLEMASARGWGGSEFDCLAALWDRESRWDAYAFNPSSGAYGIPQAVPGDKMATAGSDWRTNPRTQISWGLSYIASRYATPCGAWAHSQQRGWY